MHADVELTDGAAKKHAADYGYTCPVLIDRKHELVQRISDGDARSNRRFTGRANTLSRQD